MLVSARSVSSDYADATRADRHPLVVRLADGETRAPRRSGVAADAAPASGLGDEDLLQSSPPARDRLSTGIACSGSTHGPRARTASRRGAGIPSYREHARVSHGLSSSGATRRAGLGPQPVLASQWRTVPLLRPTSAAISPIDAPACTNFEPLALDPALGGVFLPIDRVQPVPAHPVRHGRRMAVKALGDLLDAQPLGEQQSE